ncbi:hypothetical protein GCM10010156_74380 [Planobispora rosea]|uniref:Integral membrane protein n=1 Tax=Planobispora rosea TaxID=35762 RepID=A0A8J3S8B2_PLARO|nr:hypothetical protein [Planobispora rosea]GGT05937.1 hypothetical protein GCM10010156_74380 [Planobispora rosea]GIH88664.1 hypothetical protein Pro02_70720 [Planobispora rosea]
MSIEEPATDSAPTREHVTELRIHGVAGASPGSVLFPGCPDQVTFLGDRSRDPVGIYVPANRASAPWRQEAYVWGGLTSGSRSRAFWLLMLPFALANIAFYMTPRWVVDGRERHAPLRLLVDAGQRLFALSLTGTLIVALAGTAMDVVAWQAARIPHTFTLLEWLAGAGTGDAARRVALASLLPALVLALIWQFGKTSWARFDRRPVDGGEPDPATDGVPLANRRMWNGGDPVGRLRSLHVAFGYALIALALTLPFTSDPLFGALRLGAQAVLLPVVVLVALPYAAVRHRPGGEPGWSSLLTKACAGLRTLALLLYGLALAAGVITGGPAVPDDRRALPGFHGLLEVLFSAQTALLATVTVGTAALALRSREPADPAVPYPRAMRGLAGPVTLLMAWALAAVFAIGLAFAVAEILGTPSFTGGGGRIVLSGPYWWSTLAMLLAALTAALLALWLLMSWRRETRRLVPELRARYPEHTEHVCRSWAAAGLTDKTDVVMTVIAAVAAAAVALAAALITIRLNDVPTGPAVALGVVVTAGVAVGLVYVGWQAYEHPALRSTVGVLWDVTTFWPRATHPLAPPCYAERVIPDLLDRVRILVRDEHNTVVVSGHSQGSVIAAALILQMDPADRRHTRLLTHGSPLRRLYARFFPAYFGLGTLQVLKDAVTTGPRRDGAERSCRWCNLHRRSDPIGGPVFAFSLPWAPAAGGVDEPLWDPADPSLGGSGAEGPPRIFGHSDYYLDPAYKAAFRRLIS